MGPNQSHNAWTIEPPVGCRFANQLGGEVTLYFPRGQEKAVHDHVIKRVHEAYLASLKQGYAGAVLAPPHAAPSHAAAIDMRSAYPSPAAVVPQVMPGQARTQVVKMPDGSESTITFHGDPPALASGPGMQTIGGTLASHPLDQLAGASAPPFTPSSAQSAHASAPRSAQAGLPAGDLPAGEAGEEVEALLAEVSDTIPPPVLTQCPHVQDVGDGVHEVQCSLPPHARGIHAVKAGESHYPLNLAPASTWRKRVVEVPPMPEELGGT
jgi:hypothetical protein